MKNGTPYFGITMLVLLGCLWLVTPPANAASWETNSPMVVARYWHTATLLPDGNVLAAGGYGSNSVSLNVAELFDPATGKWIQTGQMNDSRAAHAAILLPNGQVLVTGGYQYLAGQNYSVLASAELFNPATGIWTGTGSMLESRVGHTMTLLPNGQVLAVGGDGNSGPLSTAELYDPVSGKWSSTGYLNVAREWHTATLLSNGQVLVVGGYNFSSGQLSSAELYDPDSGTWTLAANPMNFSRQLHTATLLPDGRVLVAGGYGSNGPPISSAEIFDPDDQTWTATATPLTFARAQHTATLMPDGEVLVTGGYASAGTYGAPLFSAELYNPTTGIWTATNSLPVALGNQTATLLPNGNVLVAGGYSLPDLLGGTEMYDPTINPATGMWVNTGTMHDALQYEFTETLLTNGLVLVAGGIGNYGVNLANAELYNPVNQTWINTSAMSAARYSHTATLLRDGKILVAGGRNNEVLSSAELYSTSTGNWTLTGSMNVGRIEFTATLLFNGKVLVCGGYNYSSGYLSNAELYDPLFGTWTMTGSLNTARESHTATRLTNGKVLIAGGYNGSAIASAELYDPYAGTWTTVNPMTTARDGHTATLLPNGKVLVEGGFRSGSPNSTYLSSAELFDPTTATWTETGAMANSRIYSTAMLLPDGKVLVAGGDTTNAFLQSTELYDPTTGNWTITGALNTGRMYQNALLLPEGKILVTGGQGDFEGNGLSSAELYDAGLGYSNAWQPQITSVASSIILGGSLAMTGTQFRGISEGSGGNTTQESTADFPLVQLRSLESGQTMFLQATNWTATSFASAAVWDFPPGWALATVFVSGIQSTSAIVSVSVPVPTTTILTGAGFTNGHFQFSFTNTPDALFGVLATTNLSLPLTNWTALGGVTEIAHGQFEFTDPQTINGSRRFYRLYAP